MTQKPMKGRGILKEMETRPNNERAGSISMGQNVHRHAVAVAVANVRTGSERDRTVAVESDDGVDTLDTTETTMKYLASRKIVHQKLFFKCQTVMMLILNAKMTMWNVLILTHTILMAVYRKGPAAEKC